jgi:hypothetical protein
VGKRGRGALTKPKPEKKAPGRPSIRIDPVAAKHVKPLVPRAVKVLEALLGSAEEPIRLRAAKAILDHGMRLPAGEEKKNGEEERAELRVVMDKDWRTKSGKG